VKPKDLAKAGLRILTGSVPLLSIEITRECPLSCPGCYAYGDSHLGGGVTLSELKDYRGDELVEGVLALVRKHRPLHVSLVGGEPLVRHRELSRILPALSAMGVWTMVVTSAVIPIPLEWKSIPQVVVTISVDGLPHHHDARRKPATYQKILENIAGRRVNVHLTITQPMLESEGYLAEYLAFWSRQPEVNRIWLSTYTPQRGERSAEMLTESGRARLVRELPELRHRFPKLLAHADTGEALLRPPAKPEDCTFARMSVNYSADLDTRVEPCIFGGDPDCSQCGCAISTGLHAIQPTRLLGPVRVRHLVRASALVGRVVNRLRGSAVSRWEKRVAARPAPVLYMPEPPPKQKAAASGQGTSPRSR
jgi:MoaA/NifB/PqqE/SkfB family radical SAM enzyme